MRLPKETAIGHYRILSLLGTGGMGEVYLAEDTRLGRQVALKILPATGVGERQGKQRFQQEAKAASSLSNSHSCIIYEVGETSDGRPFLAMEYVAGETLATRIQGRPLPLRETLAFGWQIADALDEAHEKGIIHRDIKPSNVIITPRGAVKVLDFGLAKVNLPVAASNSEEADTQIHTEPGLILGTVHYMSPEQALGRATDERTDIFSLGVTLYEMATGRRPFTGRSATETIDHILHTQPEPITQLNHDAPPELERIVKKALRKDRAERYQTAKELLVDLRHLARDLELTNSEGRSPATSNGSPPPATSGSQLSRPEIPLATTENSRQFLPASRRGLIFAMLALALSGVAVGAYRWLGWRNRALPFQNSSVERVTTTGQAIDAVISPNGEYVAYIIVEKGLQSLWLRQLPTNGNIQAAPPANVSYQGLAFSPDSRYIFYNVWDKKGVGQIFQIPSLGGAARKVIHDCMPGLAVSPDGQRIAFIRGFARERKSALMTARVDGSDEIKLALRGNNEGFLITPAWSPDSRAVACTVGTTNSRGLNVVRLVEFPAQGGAEKAISEQQWAGSSGLVWLADNSGLLLTASTQPIEPNQLWHVAYPGGAATKLTNELDGYNSTISLTQDGQSLVSVRGDATVNLWTVAAGKPSQATKITSGKYEGTDFAWTPDNRIVYVSGITGNMELWLMDADGGNKKQLTNDPAPDVQPTVSADGRYIIFTSIRGDGIPHLWRMDLDGGNLRQLTHGLGEGNAICSPTRPEIYFAANDNNKQILWRTGIDGGAPEALTDKYTYTPAISPDGKQVAYSCWEDQPEAQHFYREILSLEDLRTTKPFTLPLTAIGGSGQVALRWTPDGRGLSFVDTRTGVPNIWIMSLEGGPDKPVTSFSDDQIFSFNWSYDGKTLAVARGAASSDVIIRRNAK